MAIDIEKARTEAAARLPVVIPDVPMSVDMTIRLTALTVAARFVADITVREGALYQQLKMDNKLGHPVSTEDAIRAALVFERYLWGEWSKGIAENALAATDSLVADALEKEFEKRRTAADDALEDEFKEEPSIRSHGGGES